MKKLVVILAALGLLPYALQAQTDPEILASDIRYHLKYLASPELAGRGSGTEGNRTAAAYIADWMKRDAISPAGDGGSYFQNFDFVAAVRLGDSNHLAIIRPAPAEPLVFVANQDFRPLAFSSSATVSGEILFAGYGISAPDSNYDDYQGLDVRDRVVVVLRYGPDGTDPQSPFAKYTSFRNKARVARDKGAAAIIFLNGPRDEQDDDLLKLTYDQSFESSGIPALSMKRDVIERLIAPSGMNLRAIQDSIKASRKPVRISLGGTAARIQTDVRKVKARTANVAGLLKGNDTLLNSQVVILGAHFDHLGYGGRGSGSLVPDTIAIHPGADDNASGTSGLLELMEAFSAKRKELKRSILFLFFSGEELGTLGSGYYVNHPLVPLERSVAMVNMDMVGRLENSRLTVYGTGTSPVWAPLLSRFNKDSSFTIKTIPDGFGPSDHSQFYGKDMPVLFFFTGTHNDYHKPSDTWEKINYAGEERVVRYVKRIVDAVDVMPERPAFARSQAPAPASSGDTRSFSVTLGIIPDYAEGTEGMKIGGIRPNGPAEKAGLKAGDVITKMAGKKVLNIYDYMGLLGELKAGDVVEIEALRGGAIVTLKATMEKRK
jgi:hypothetical protein